MTPLHAHRLFRLLATAILLSVFAPAAQAQQDSDNKPPLVPESAALARAARNAIDADYLTDDERRALRVFHGVWDESDLTDSAASAMVALNAWDLQNPALFDDATPVELRAEAALLSGDAHRANNLLEAADSLRGQRIRGQALESLGRYEEAAEAAQGPVTWFNDAVRSDPESMTEAVRAMSLKARITGAPADDYQHMLRILTRVHQDLDRLHWPALLAEARLRLEKHNYEQAVESLHDVLDLNPRCADAWYMLGLIALERYDFESGNAAAEHLRRLNPEHPLASLLMAESRLIQDDPDQALDLLDTLLRRHRHMRPGLALKAAAHAVRFDRPATRAALAYYDSLSPGSASAYYVAGRHLSMKHQHAPAAELLSEAARRQPRWPAPVVEMGLLAMRRGRDDEAMQYITAATALDPFDKRAANTMKLMKELITYDTIETDHFILRYRPGVDHVVADMMGDELEPMHEMIASRYRHEPPVRTLIELMPDRTRLAVRLTGMPQVGALAACTGPVIVFQTPAEGAARTHYGLFDWPRVLRHEYTHTITLSQTEFRVPRWLTEGAAQVMELGPRTYGRCRMLASSYHNNTLFDLDEIDWAFIRPRKTGDVGKAYAQGLWMTEFIGERFGEESVITLLDRYLAGQRTAEAIPAAFEMSQEQFYREFLRWAESQIKDWGLAPMPTMTELTDELRWSDPDLALAMAASQKARLDAIVSKLTEQIGRPATGTDQRMKARDWPELVRPPVAITDQQLQRWRGLYPDHPDLLEKDLRRRIDDDGKVDASMIPLLERYAELRPVDPFPHKRLAQFHLNQGNTSHAIRHLEYLDARVEDTVVYAMELARLYRAAGDAPRALVKITRVLQIDPYDASHRELAAAMSIEANRYDLARRHIFALTLLEPDRQKHRDRLQRIDAIIADREASVD